MLLLIGSFWHYCSVSVHYRCVWCFLLGLLSLISISSSDPESIFLAQFQSPTSRWRSCSLKAGQRWSCLALISILYVFPGGQHLLPQRLAAQLRQCDIFCMTTHCKIGPGNLKSRQNTPRFTSPAVWCSHVATIRRVGSSRISQRVVNCHFQPKQC